MTQENQPNPAVENQGGEQTPNNDPNTTGGQGTETNNYEGKTREEIVADLQVKFKDLPSDKLLEKMAEQMEIIGHKNRAINSLKNKPANVPQNEQPKPAVDEDVVKKIVDSVLGEVRKTTAVDTIVGQLASSPEERQAIMDAYDKDVVKSGDVQSDLKKAMAIANARLIEEYKANRSESEVREEVLTRFMGGNSYGQPPITDNTLNTPAKKAAAENLKKLGLSDEQIKKSMS